MHRLARSGDGVGVRWVGSRVGLGDTGVVARNPVEPGSADGFIVPKSGL